MTRSVPIVPCNLRGPSLCLPPPPLCLSLSLSWSLDFQRKNDLGTLWSLTCEIHYIPSSSTFLFSTRVRGWTRVETIFKRGNNYYCYYYYIVESFRVDLSFLFFFFYVTIWNLIKGTVLWTLSLSLHFFFFPFPKYFVFRRKFYSLQDRIPRKVLSRSNFDSLRIRFTDRVKVEKSRAYSSDTQHNRVTAVLTLIDARLARWGGRRGRRGRRGGGDKIQQKKKKVNFDGRHREIIHIKKNIANGCTNVAMLVAFFNGRIVASFPRNVGRMNYLTYKYIYIYLWWD